MVVLGFVAAGLGAAQSNAQSLADPPGSGAGPKVVNRSSGSTGHDSFSDETACISLVIHPVRTTQKRLKILREQGLDQPQLQAILAV